MKIEFEWAAGDTLRRIGEAKEAPIDAIPTPFPSWNALCGEEGGCEGLAKSWLVVLGGNDGAGKSYAATNMVAGAVLQGKRVGGINFEMTQEQSVTRYMSILTGIPKRRLDRGRQYSPAEWRRGRAILDELEGQGAGFITNRAAVFSLDDIRESYDKLSDEGCEMILLDYAQLVTVGGKDGIFQRTEEVANTLRELTHRYKVVSLVLSQFNREMKLADHPPTRHGLQGGSAWENNANQIILIDHTLQAVNATRTMKYSQLIGDKNRHGLSPFTIPIRWTFDTMRLEEYVPGTDPDDPFPKEGEDEQGVEVKPISKTWSEDTRDLFERDREEAPF